MKHFLLFLLCLLTPFITTLAQCPTLVWSDEFDGNTLDLNKWEPMIGDGCDYGICGWGNNELQYYKSENAVVSDGTLKIIVKNESVRKYKYTSARLRTKGLADFTFGRYEARIKLMEGQGLWPAFWMLSTNEPYGAWPQSGEIDIMELIGQHPEVAHGTIHYGQPWPDNSNTGASHYLYNGATYKDDFHVFAVEWEPGEIRWYMDDILYSVKTDADIAPENWPFDSGNQMHFLLNVAVGGSWPGSPDETTPIPTQMEVDYVRVYDNGFKPSISGSREVRYQAQEQVYTINNPGTGSSFDWSVPSGATIVSGQGTNTVSVNFGSSGGDITCNVSNSCITNTYKIDVLVEPNYVYSSTFENFDAPAVIAVTSSSGTFNEVSNPSPDAVNSSAVVAEYTRNIEDQYDVIAYSTSAIPDAGLFKTKQNKFYMDVNTAAPAGTKVIIQLESSEATPSNYPSGRHSRYEGTITKNGEWERVVFDYLDAPDPSTPDSDVANIIILFNSNSLTGDTYYWDNFDNYQAEGGESNQNPTASFTTSVSNLNVDFDGSSSTDSDGTITSWQWDFGDGNGGSGATVSHTYSGAGTYSVTLTVTDNDGASNSSTSQVSVSEGSSGDPVSMHVQSVIVGTVSAERGNNSGTATVVIHDNNENVVSGATVFGTFSGTFNESVSGITDSNGEVTFVTSGAAKGSLAIDFCIDNLTGGLTYSPIDNDISCTTSNARINVGNLEEELKLQFYPNPASSMLNLYTIFDKVELYDLKGQLLKVEEKKSSIDVSNLVQGVFIIKVVDEDQVYRSVFIKK
ncbi:family 16 glycosylhydrolase [Flammeovirga sp. MY04]|uniref:family 16 glycosylhydrolase n=1 Tax=Flammeovirga sp. MY04 TaxID=1191459 RepID=UPI000824AA34|nr:family 16 glycosylhydrolase [Flammeovirga sp. MY04]ANQ49564.2 family 16 glycosylhydrolase [Flammeovirga sp. MY04]